MGRSIVKGLAAALSLISTQAYPLAAQEIRPPQGYVGFDRGFAGPVPEYWNGTQHGHYRFSFPFRLENTSGELAGTFWSNSIGFHNSDAELPVSHVGGIQGGYLGVQVKSPTESIAIFSLWWALDARPGTGAHCVDETEAWYTDGRPWTPRIDTMADVDPSRPFAGGPFRSCRLPIDLRPGVTYRLQVYEIADAREPDLPEWWGASLVDTSTGQETVIGALQVPATWGWLTSSAGGFIEHFGPMPAGCGSIPASTSFYFAANADDGMTSTIDARLYGQCAADLAPRTRMECGGGQCAIQIGR